MRRAVSGTIPLAFGKLMQSGTGVCVGSIPIVELAAMGAFLAGDSIGFLYMESRRSV